MAIILGMSDSKETHQLLEAGYEVAPASVITALLASGEAVMAVWVDCDISDLLSPPLCKFCGRLMETHSDMDTIRIWTGRSIGTSPDVVHICPNCGACVQVITHPPREE